jgi:hypothetical protein
MFSRRLFLAGAEVTPLPSAGLSEPLIKKTLGGKDGKVFTDADTEEETDTACTFVYELMFIIMTITV